LALYPALELAEIDEDAAIRSFAPETALHPSAVLDFVPHGVFAVAGDFGE